MGRFIWMKDDIIHISVPNIWGRGGTDLLSTDIEPVTGIFARLDQHQGRLEGQ